MALVISFKDDGTVATIQRLGARAKNSDGLLKVGGREVANTLRKHFREKNVREPNKLGGKRENFWNKIGSSVSDGRDGRPDPAVVGKTVIISINDPRIAQKVFGGEIRAKRVKNLAIPLEPEAYGRSPSTFESETGIKLVFIKQRNSAFLAQVKGSGLQAEYLLTPKVDQAADPTALPSEQVMSEAFISRAEKYLDREGKNEQP